MGTLDRRPEPPDEATDTTDAEPLSEGTDAESSPTNDFLRALAHVSNVAPISTPSVADGSSGHFGVGDDPWRFELRRRIGAGGFGTVYEAFDQKRGATVALKVLHRRDPHALYLFKKEFRALAGIAHPNLVQLFELHADEGRWFFTMELVRGEHAIAHVRAGRGFDEARVRALLQQLAEGLCFVHEAGKLHRDIKPSNVMVDGRGVVKILDFGLVADVAEGVTEGRAGTPSYMAPEQAAGGPVGPPADWFAVGVMLHEALTGRLPSAEEPSPRAIAPEIPEDLERLCVDLLARDPAARPTGREVLARLGGVPAALPVVSAGARAPFVGRSAELAQLDAALADARAGRTVVVLVHGSSGIGKTSLVQRFLDEAASRADVLALTGRCFQQEAVPYKALDGLIDAIGQRLGRASPAERAAWLPPDVTMLARLFPVLRQVRGIEAPVDGEGEIDLRRPAFAAFRALCARIGRDHALALFIDDLQWGDLDSVALLIELLRAPSPPLLLVTTYRAEEAATSAVVGALSAALRDELHGAVDVREIALGELVEAEAEELAGALLGAAPPRTRSLIASEGRHNPFFITELARWAAEDEARESLPRGLPALLEARIVRLPAPARRLLEAVAVAGQPIRRAIAAIAADLGDGGEEPQALALLRVQQLLRVQEVHEREELLAYHDRIREAVVALLAPEALGDRHLGLALALEASGDADPALLFHHFRAAGRTAEAASYAVEAAARAHAALAFDRAARFYREALDLGGHGEAEVRALEIGLARALAGAGRPREAAQAYLAVSMRETSNAAQSHRRQAMELLLTGGYADDGLAALELVLREVGLALPASAPEAIASLLALRARLAVRGLDFRERPEHAVPEKTLLAVDACWSAASALGLVDPLRSAALQARHLLLALEAGEIQRVARALSVEVIQRSLFRGRGDERTASLLARATELTERSGRPAAQAIAAFIAGAVAMLHGDMARCEPLLRRALASAAELRAAGSGQFEIAYILLGLCLWARGGIPELTEMMSALLADARERGNRFREIAIIVNCMAPLELAAGRPAACREVVDAAMGRWSRAGVHTQQHLRALLARVNAARYEGDGRGAMRIMVDGWPALVRSGLLLARVPRVEALVARALAALTAASEGGLRAAPLLALAARDARTLERLDATWSPSFAAAVRAGIAARRGRLGEAVTRMREGETGFRQGGALLYAVAAQRRRGEWLGGDEGRALVAEADAWMTARAIRDPARLAAMLVG